MNDRPYTDVPPPSPSAADGPDPSSRPSAPVESPLSLPVQVPADRSLRLRLEGLRNHLLQEGATNLIKLGNELPGLKQAGYWLYGTATLCIPRGNEVGKLGSVGERVLRGAQPSLRAFKTLKDLGVDTVINLRPESDHERPIVARNGMKYVYLPLPPLDAPTHAITVQFLEAATDPANGTVFFHCYHGVDRTGTMAACLRLARDGWTVEEALAEMRAYKVHEHGQRSKLQYVSDFATYWATVPTIDRRRILHIPDPDLPVLPAATPGLLERFTSWVSERWSRVKRA
jgi:protein tyrosine phosphatase (PTP) superfamily phosphohydrolase (DUF442 family)